jgi:RNA polymerase sigma factor (sigma-70 family)
VDEARQGIIDWVALHVLPNEGYVRARLRRVTRRSDEIDDVIQEAYCRIAELDTVAHIRDGRAYFLAAARSILLQRIRRERVVRIEAVTDVESLGTIDESPSPEEVAGARGELQRVLALIAGLPPMCRQVIELRKLHGFSQKETARRLGVSEAVVENNSVRDLRALLKALEADPTPRAPRGAASQRPLPVAHARR